jgi:phosphoribosyl-ATP pyrophosphohydrolase
MPLDQKYHSLPLYSHSKTNKKYQTPNKSLLTTTNTHNITLSMYSLKSKSKHQEPQRPTITSNNQIQPTAIRGKSEINKKMGSKTKVKVSKTKTKKLSKSNKKKIAKKVVEETKKEEIMQTNKEFFKHIRESVDCQSTSAFLSKISDIFDLASLSSELPIEV